MSILKLLNPMSYLCGVPIVFRIILAFFMAFINIPCLISLFIPLLLIFGFAIPPTNHFNHDPNNKDPESKNWNMASGWAFLVYYIITTLWILGSMYFICSVSEMVDPYAIGGAVVNNMMR